LLDGSSSHSAGSGDELDENDRSVCGWLLKVGVIRTLEGVVTGCLARPGHGLDRKHVGTKGGESYIQEPGHWGFWKQRDSSVVMPQRNFQPFRLVNSPSRLDDGWSDNNSTRRHPQKIHGKNTQPPPLLGVHGQGFSYTVSAGVGSVVQTFNRSS
jgi:hypothetical protein